MSRKNTGETNAGRRCNGCILFPEIQPPKLRARSAGTMHQRVSLKIAAALLRYTESAKLGQVFQAPFDVMLSRDVIIQPDIIFVKKGRSGLIGETGVLGAPDLAVEILSQSKPERDLHTRKKIYSRFEVKEFWTVDPDKRLIEVLLWSELGYATQGLYGGSDRLSSPALPGLLLPLQKVF
jgi:Uma2 family endonuclease